MSCYCRSIPKCGRDIRKVERALNYMEQAYGLHERGIKNSLSNLDSNHGMCITPDNISILSETVTYSNNPLLERLRSLSQCCLRELRGMENTLSDMEDSDDRYHDSEDDD